MDVADSGQCHWYRSLKCSICLDYFRNPHTLKCGHSFCIECVTRLVSVANQQNPEVATSRLRVLCPSCRRQIPAKVILKKRLSINYSLQEFVDNWLKEQNNIRHVPSVDVRSVGSQSADEDSGEEPCDISQEEFGQLSPRAGPVNISTSELETIATQVQERLQWSQCTDNVSDAESSDAGSSGLAPEDGRINNVAAIDIPVTLVEAVRNIIFDIGYFFCDLIRSPNRSVMAIVWTGYTLSIMLISSGFFPYMLLYSILFFLILYAETLEQRRINRH